MVRLNRPFSFEFSIPISLASVGKVDSKTILRLVAKLEEEGLCTVYVAAVRLTGNLTRSYKVIVAEDQDINSTEFKDFLANIASREGKPCPIPFSYTITS